MDDDILSTDFISVNQNNDEEEELEDRKLREEEIHNLLSHAMDEFEFDDHSTDADDSVLSSQTQVPYDEQYREADISDQLKILYEVRVREVAALNNEIALLKAQYSEQEQNLKKKLILLEADNRQKNISLKESHELLVEKSENLKNLNEEVEHLKNIIKSLENGISEVKQENMLLLDSNMKLQQQIVIMERGFPLQNKFADKELLEIQKSKIMQLEADIEKMIGQIEQKEKQHKESLRELKEELQEKTNLLCEKDSVISILSENYNSAQQHYSDLSHTIEELKASKSNEQKGSPLEEELRKIREQNEKTEIITRNVRKIVSQEYESKIAALNSEKKSLDKALESKKTEFKNLQEQLQEISSLKIKHESLLNEAFGLQQKVKSTEIERDNIQIELQNLQKKHHSLDDERTILEAELSDCKNNLEKIKVEYQVCHKRALELETLVENTCKPVTLDTSIQASLPIVNNDEVDRLIKANQELHNRLLSVQPLISRLQSEVKLLAEENVHLKERENLIKRLQQKAEQFERIIYEKQMALENVKTSTVGVNTDAYEDSSILKVKYDALLYQTETKLRKKIKKEFDVKLEKFIQQTLKEVKTQECEKCATLTAENKKLEDLRGDDRTMVAKLVDMWAQKFLHLEKESDRKLKDLDVAYSQKLVAYVTKLEQEYNDKFQKFSRQFQGVVLELKRQKSKVGTNIQRPDLLNERLERIMAKIEKGNEKVVAIETQYSHRKDLERS